MTQVKLADLPVFDAADYLQSEQACAEYVSVVREDGDPALIAAALDDVAKARGIREWPAMLA
jgi:probable addiction module antidote protein